MKTLMFIYSKLFCLMMDNDNKEQKKDISSLEFEKFNPQNDFKILIRKLKSISENINLLEKQFFVKEEK